jgi:DNA-binding CsgD family transcriptional regulator
MPPRGRPLIPPPVLAHYQAGEIQIADVARLLGLGTDAATRRLRRAGADTSRSARRFVRAARRKGLPPPVAPSRVPAEVARLYARGHSLRQVGARFGLTPEGVRQILLKRGLELRPSGPARPRPDDCRPIAARLRALRAAAGLSQRGLAARCGLTPPTVRHAEHARGLPTRGTLEKLARGLGVGLKALGVHRPED